MTPQHRNPATNRRARRAIAALSAAALLLGAAACGDDDDTSAETTTTTEATGEETTTTTEAADDDDDDQGEDDEGGDATEAELLALLPDVSAIAPDYTEVPASDDDGDEDSSAFEDAMEEACPEAAELLAQDDDDDDTAEREYDGTLERSLTVGLDPTPRNLDEDTIDDAVAAISSCETVTLSEDGFDMTIDLTAEREDTYGDRGVLVTVNLSMAHAELPAPLTLEMRGRIFQVGDLGAQVNVTSGFDEASYEPVPGDFDLLDTLAVELETAAASHEG